MKKHFGPDNLEFTLKPSQWVTVGWLATLVTIIVLTLIYHVTSGFLAVICGILLLGWLCNRLIIACWRYDFNERTVSERKGVLTVRTREFHYFRIKSIRVVQPLLFRIVGLVNYDVVTSDPLMPMFRIYAVADDGTELRDILKKKATYWRKEMGVKETDFHDF
jgi:membrane protein YdbS with pleckstrin-like domain